MERNTVRPVDKDTIDHVIDADGGHQTHDAAANACYTAAGYNFRRFLAWLAVLWHVYIMALLADVSRADLAPLRDSLKATTPRVPASGIKRSDEPACFIHARREAPEGGMINARGSIAPTSDLPSPAEAVRG
jgi:hypothetical protein